VWVGAQTGLQTTCCCAITIPETTSGMERTALATASIRLHISPSLCLTVRGLCLTDRNTEAAVSSISHASCQGEKQRNTTGSRRRRDVTVSAVHIICIGEQKLPLRHDAFCDGVYDRIVAVTESLVLLLCCDGADLSIGRQSLNDLPYAVPNQSLHAAVNGCAEHVGGSGS
jgi:hypothetical protein